MDAGLSSERTSLAWQRTALSVLAGSAVLGRLTFDELGPVAVGLLLVAGTLAMWVFIASRARGADPGINPPAHGRRALLLSTATATLVAMEAFALTFA